MTEEVEQKILKAVALGVWPDRAAEMHGISKGTMRAHRKRNPNFATSVKEAEAKAEASFLGKILRHTDKQWTAAAWMLERRWPERWAKRDAPPAPPKVNADGESPAVLALLQAAETMPGLRIEVSRKPVPADDPPAAPAVVA